jgi:hypothetical protein
VSRHHISSLLFSSLPTRGILACCLAPPTREDMIGVGKATTFRWDSPPRRSRHNGFDSDPYPARKMVYALITETHRLGHAATSVLVSRPKTEGQTCHMNYAMVGSLSACLCVQKCAHCGRTRLSSGSPLSETCGYQSARLHFTLCRLSDEHPH